MEIEVAKNINCYKNYKLLRHLINFMNNIFSHPL